MRSLLTALLLTIIALGGVGFGQATKPSAGAAPFVTQKLANGLDVIVLEDHSVPLVNIEIAVRNGSFTEPPELNGLSHLYEHMFFKANRAIASQEEYLKKIAQLGIAYNGTTTTERVNYFFTASSQNLRPVMTFMRDAIRYPLFDEKEFERERQVVVGEIDRNESNPYYYLNEEMTKRLFYQYPSRKDPLGNRKTVTTATPDMMRLIQSRYYVPNNSALIVAGDVHPDEVFKLAQELYADWLKREKDPFVEFPLVEHPPLKGDEAGIVEQPIQNVAIQIGWHGPSIGRDDPGTYAADVFSYILRQSDSRFQRNLVDTGLVDNAGIGYYTQRNVGPITLTASTTPDKAHAAVKAIYEEIRHFTDKDYFTDEQLENAKALLEASDLYSREKFDDYSHTIAFWWSTSGLDYFRGYLTNLRKIQRTDVDRYLKTYIVGKPHVALALISHDNQQQTKLTPEELTGK